MNKSNIVQGEFDIAQQESEYFNGRYANLGKMQVYENVKGDLTTLLENCEDVIKLEMAKPNKRKPNALLCLDIKPISIFGRDNLEKLSDIMKKVDRVIVSGGNDCDCVRISFGIENIWED